MIKKFAINYCMSIPLTKLIMDWTEIQVKIEHGLSVHLTGFMLKPDICTSFTLSTDWCAGGCKCHAGYFHQKECAIIWGIHWMIIQNGYICTFNFFIPFSPSLSLSLCTLMSHSSLASLCHAHVKSCSGKLPIAANSTFNWYPCLQCVGFIFVYFCRCRRLDIHMLDVFTGQIQVFIKEKSATCYSGTKEEPPIGFLL